MLEARPREMYMQLPSATALLLLTTLAGPTNGHVLPRQTKTVEYHEINAVAWPPLPTAAPVAAFDLFGRQEDNTICGFVGGNSDFPATCSAGSHCALDTDNSMVGCCPNGGSCSVGVFTNCVDRNSDPQTEINPYVFTCGGSNVCYLNVYEGGFSQYGCGSASHLATTIATTAKGIQTTLDFVTTSVEKTQEPSTLDKPTTIGTPDSTRSTTSSPISTDTSTSSSSSSSSTTSSSTTTTDDPTSKPTSTSSSSPTTSGSADPADQPGSAPSNEGDDNKNVGAIVGGTIGGVALIVILAALFIYMRKRRASGGRQSPGIGPIGPPMTQYTGPGPVHGAAFAPLNSWHEEEEQGYDNHAYVPSAGGYYDSHGQQSASRSLRSHSPEQPPHAHYNPAHVPGIGSGLAPVAEEQSDAQPSMQEIDDFSRAYSAAAIGTVEEDRVPLTPTAGPFDDQDHDPYGSSGAESVDASSFPSPPSRAQRGSRPLWQQNRQQSRNLMWQ